MAASRGLNVRTGSGLLVGLLILCSASGLLSLVVNNASGDILMILHRSTGIALLLLIPWKARIIGRSWKHRLQRGISSHPRSLDLSTAVSGLVLGAFLASLCLGLAWALAVLPDRVQGFSPLLLHWWIGLGMAPPLLWHLLARWPRPRTRDFAGRRRFLFGLGGAALSLVSGTVLAKVSEALHQGGHRWSGSRHAGDFTSNAMPVTIFLADTVPAIDAETWRLTVKGAVQEPLRLSLAELAALGKSAQHAVLDCTSGWYSTQSWSGIRLTVVLKAAGASMNRFVVVRSATGYLTVLTPNEIPDCLLATHISGDPLAADHGAPMRLVAPSRRGWQWIKWVSEIEVI